MFYSPSGKCSAFAIENVEQDTGDDKRDYENRSAVRRAVERVALGARMPSSVFSGGAMVLHNSVFANTFKKRVNGNQRITKSNFEIFEILPHLFYKLSLICFGVGKSSINFLISFSYSATPMGRSMPSNDHSTIVLSLERQISKPMV